MIAREKKLISKMAYGEGIIKYFVINEEIFELIHEAHIQTGHGGQKRTEDKVDEKYANITRMCSDIYLQSCIICEKTKSLPKKGLVVKPLLFKGANKRSYVDLVNMQTCPDQEFKYFMNYQDHLTKFCVLKPLKTKSIEKVVYNLLDIFCLLGPPAVL